MRKNAKLCRRPGAVIALLLLAGVWCGEILAQENEDQGQISGGPVGIDCSIRVRTPPEQKVPRQERQVFSATEILDLQFDVVIHEPLKGEHLLRLELFTPNSHLYQVLTVPFTIDPVRAGSERMVEGYPRPLELQVAESEMYKGVEYPVVSALFPVAGTSIVHSSLYGRWRIVAKLDGNPQFRCWRRPFFIVE